jgi:preprotein translocase subunit SecB
MTEQKKVKGPKTHPIQLEGIFVREMSIISNVPPSEEVGISANKIDFYTAHSEYREEDKEISVSLKVECGQSEDDDQPYSMKIDIVAYFNVDDEKFPIEHIHDWARRNAPLILIPYIREHAFGLTARCGFKPLILPLMEVPTFKIPKG